MRIRCKYCDSFIEDTDEFCSNCGGVNTDLKRIADGVPKTIEELQKWYIDHNLPSEDVTRFFIGKDIKEPRAFGIYFDSSRNLFVVYKNKSNGSRAIRYEGKDEAYAVNELYLRLKEEIVNQKNRNNNNYSNTNFNTYSTMNSNVKKNKSLKIIFILVVVYFGIQVLVSLIFLFGGFGFDNYLYNGYYKYNNNYYYYYYESGNEIWYKITDVDNNVWVVLDGKEFDDDFNKNSRNYYLGDILLEKYDDDNKLPDTIDSNTSGYFFGNCEEGNYLSNDINYYYYGSVWYKYDSNWIYIERKDLDTIDESLRKSCLLFKADDNKDLSIPDFRTSSYYTPEEGYYLYEGIYYYYFKGSWYKYDDYWSSSSKFYDEYYNYYEGSYYDSINEYNDYEVENFRDSDYYKNYYDKSSSSSSSSSSSYDYDDDWDSGSSWDSSDSWDSGSTDWDSDW